MHVRKIQGRGEHLQQVRHGSWNAEALVPWIEAILRQGDVRLEGLGADNKRHTFAESVRGVTPIMT